MSVRSYQIKHSLENAAYYFYSSGIVPTLGQLLARVAQEFQDHAADSPKPIDESFFAINAKSDVGRTNELLFNCISNLNTIYGASLEQVSTIMELNTALRSQVDALTASRQQLETLIDNYLLSTYNSDGYFLSVGDSFAGIDLTDLRFTSANVDTASGAVVLPTLSTFTTKIDLTQAVPSSSLYFDALPINITEQTPFSGAIDDLTNTFWLARYSSNQPGELVLRMTIDLPHVDISRFEILPYVISQVQIAVEVGVAQPQLGITYLPFGNVVTTTEKMAINDVVVTADQIRLTFRKTNYDYIDKSSGVVKYQYLVGLRDLSIYKQAHDSNATFVSTPLTMPSEMTTDTAIDAVSISVESDLPADTYINYYLAEDNPDAQFLDDFIWRGVQPSTSDQGISSIVRFEGAQTQIAAIRPIPTAKEIQLIPLNSISNDVTFRNPSPVIVPGADIYRIARLPDVPLANSMTLEEGINTLRVYSTDLDPTALDLDYWVENQTMPTFFRIDTGHGFYWGGGLSGGNKSVYAETSLVIDQSITPFFSTFEKLDSSSLAWDIKLYLNGRQVASVPSGTPSAVIKWSLLTGVNNFIATINIPQITSGIDHPNLGAINLFGDRNLFDFGTVKLATWNFISLFDMQHNAIATPHVYSLYNNEIVSRSPSSTDLRVQYSTATGRGPTAVRFRADLGRSTQTEALTPALKDYKIRFSYGAE